MKRFGVYKMMIQSTILQNSSINAVPDHFIKAIVASECILSNVFLMFEHFWRCYLKSMFGCFPLVFSSQTFPRTILWISLVLPEINQGSGGYKMQFSNEVHLKTSNPLLQLHFITHQDYCDRGMAVYKMMIQSTILQNSSINAVPDHFYKGHCCIGLYSFKYFSYFSVLLKICCFFIHVC